MARAPATIRLAAVAAAAALAACGGGGSAGTTGGLEVRMRDRPIEAAEHVYVTIESVEVLRLEGETEVREVVASTPGQHDLLELQHGVEAVLGGGTFPAGTYAWIRLVVAADPPEDVETLPADALRNYVVVDGVAHPLVVPSGAQTGIKLGHEFTIEAGETTVLTLDFDVRQSVHACGRGDTYRLTPVIRVVPTVVEGAPGAPSGLAGTVATADGAPLPAGTVVSVQQEGVEVGSASPDATGAYAVAGLPDGTYGVIVIAPGHAFATATGVAVTGGSAAGPHDFTLTPAGTGAVAGTVESSSGAPVTVRARWEGFLVQTVGADALGAFALEGLPEGSYTVEATDGTSTASTSAYVTPGETTDLSLFL